MKVLITGAGGFIGKNLIAHLRERENVEILCFAHGDDVSLLPAMTLDVDFVFHLAGVNRPQDPHDFQAGNTDLTRVLCDAIKAARKPLHVLYTSSIQAEQDNLYGNSKRGAEEALLDLAGASDVTVHLFRLPNVFGKWARPNYNSVVATFCHNIARDLPIQVNDPQSHMNLVYIDDVVRHFIAIMDGQKSGSPFISVEPQYSTKVGELAEQLYAFRNSRKSMITEAVGTGLVRALYSTYLSYLSPESFTYEVPLHQDPRGVFVEMLKTKDSGQFSFFTAHPGITRGGHYHHSKTEKFLVISGKASFRFRQIMTGEFYELSTTGEVPKIVETVPGWSHDITNIGDEDMIVMLWANEIFDREHSDTFARTLSAEA